MNGETREDYPIGVRLDARRLRWYQKLAGVVWVMFCLEIGVFLVVYPWMDGWERNSAAEVVPLFRRWWDNSYFRGAISGIGISNVTIALVDLFRLFQRWFFPEGEAGEDTL